MIPFFRFTAFQIGPVTIQVWGLMVSLGILAALGFALYLSKKYILSSAIFTDLALYSIVGGMLGARLFHIVFYNSDYYLANPGEILAVWHGGASSLGGFFGAATAAYIFAKVRRFTWATLVPYIDIGVLSLWLGWGIGRIGCFLIHDHPGTLTHFVLGVRYPEGVRHDLGLYDSIVGFILFFIFWALFSRLTRKAPGLLTAASALSYALIRFCLDFLRATDLEGADIRYTYLTPAQWGMLVVIGLTGSFIYTKMRQHKRGEVA